MRRRGIFVEFDYTIEGYKDDALTLRWQLIDALGGDQLAKSRDTLITPEAPKDGGSHAVWVPLPARRAARPYVQLQLYEPRGEVSIGRVRTARFSPPAGVRALTRPVTR